MYAIEEKKAEMLRYKISLCGVRARTVAVIQGQRATKSGTIKFTEFRKAKSVGMTSPCVKYTVALLHT